MLQVQNKARPAQAALRKGLLEIAQTLHAAYGNEGKLLARTQTGEVVCTSKLEELLNQAVLQSQEAEWVRKMFVQITIQDGMKTAVLLTNALFDALDAMPWSLNGLGSAVHHATVYLDKIAANNDGVLPGGGLYLLNLVRPLTSYARKENVPEAQALASAMSAPLLALAASAGFAPHEVYERVKAAAPNQFYSLHHFGLSGSVREDAAFCDVLTVGLEVESGKMTNLVQHDVTVPLETGKAVLEAVQKMTACIAEVQAIL